MLLELKDGSCPVFDIPDLLAERIILRDKAFPQLTDMCKNIGLQFQVNSSIDYHMNHSVHCTNTDNSPTSVFHYISYDCLIHVCVRYTNVTYFLSNSAISKCHYISYGFEGLMCKIPKCDLFPFLIQPPQYFITFLMALRVWCIYKNVTYFPFQAVDLHWGLRDVDYEDMIDTDLCLKEIKDCQRKSIGPCFCVSIYVYV